MSFFWSGANLKSLSLKQYQKLVDTGTVIEQDGRGVKVIKTLDGRIVKLFRLKSVFSSAVLKSYAARFVENAELLKQRGINTIDAQDLYYCKPIKRTLVYYHPLPGSTLRDLLREGDNTTKVMKMFSAFMAELHDKGILFRSVHFNNVIVSESGDSLGLIDVADMRIKGTSLSVAERVRNFKHMVRYQEDCTSIETFGVAVFLEEYLHASEMDVSKKEPFLKLLRNKVPFFDQCQQGVTSG